MARALDLHSRGQGFDSLILHAKRKEDGRPKSEVRRKKLQKEKKAARQNVHRNNENSLEFRVQGSELVKQLGT